MLNLPDNAANIAIKAKLISDKAKQQNRHSTNNKNRKHRIDNVLS